MMYKTNYEKIIYLALQCYRKELQMNIHYATERDDSSALKKYNRRLSKVELLLEQIGNKYD